MQDKPNFAKDLPDFICLPEVAHVMVTTGVCISDVVNTPVENKEEFKIIEDVLV